MRSLVAMDAQRPSGRSQPRCRPVTGAGAGAGAGLLLCLLLAAALLSACSSGATPQPTARSYLADWARQDWAAMRLLVASPPGRRGTRRMSALNVEH
jgi:hypothetical protein